ncbi:Zn-finger containing NTP pyrophosphohydrolase [Candidatus Propionivibrio aalborgensis]|uniref:GDP-mannose pyrophosphatase n=2 Tax=Candidatus Propionivibrio aalborgensis TaxID=1860101 RepID=A0A1A8XUM8_9RHOO|nr:Zn-finger containing NTP pyrophosphohydrolase [Candidatus Propionivibrio aalborgensis]
MDAPLAGAFSFVGIQMKKQLANEHAHLEETQIESTQVYRGKLLDVRLDRVRLPDGHESAREYVIHQGAVVIIPVLDSGELIFERQYRYPLRRAFLELPAGKIEDGEDILKTATRELLEETGHSASQWRYLGVVHPCIGYSNERIEIYIAQGLRRESDQQLDHGEFLDVLNLSLDEALDAIRRGDVTDGKTIAALFWAEKVLRSGW